MSKKAVFPFDGQDIFYYSHGRAALFFGMKGLGIKEGHEVLIPEYICNVVLAPFYELKVKAVYYKVNRDLTPDWEDVQQKRGPHTKAFLIINYFGFPNDLVQARQWCDSQGLFLIEDNAHGFLSDHKERPLGSIGDISIFSFYKTIVIAAGAALVVNNKKIFNAVDVALEKTSNEAEFLLRNTVRKIKRFLRLPLDAAKLVRQITPTEQDRAQEFSLKGYLGSIPPVSRYKMDHVDALREKTLRRHRYQGWLNYFSKRNREDVQVLFPVLEPNVCPYVFPVYVEDRENFIREMALAGTAAFVWPYMPHDSKEQDLSQHMVCLPVDGR